MSWVAAFAALAIAEAPFGLNGTKSFHVPEQLDGAVAQRFEWMRELGVTWDRIDLWWHVVEPERGVWDWSRPDMLLKHYENQGVTWYPILCYGPAWNPERTALIGRDEVQAYAEFAEQAATRYRGRVPVWSIWNEPNIPTFWGPQPDPQTYAWALREASEAIRRSDPEARVAGMALAPIGPWDRGFTEAVFREGGLDSIDIFDVHFYRHLAGERDYVREIEEIRATMRRFGGEKPIWISEQGVTSVLDGLPRDPDEVAAIVIRQHLAALALGVERIFHFDLQNWTDDEPQTWDTQLGLVTAAGERKPVFAAYRTMVEVVGDARPVGLDLRGDVWHAVWRRDDGTVVLAVWAETGAQTIDVHMGFDAGIRIDLNGTTSDTFTVERVEAGLAPVFLVGADEQYATYARLKPEASRVITVPGQSLDLLARGGRFESLGVDALSFGPERVRWDGVRLTVDAQTPPGEYVVRGRLVEGVTAKTVEISVEVLPEVRSSSRVAPSEHGFALMTEVVNETPNGRLATYAAAGSLRALTIDPFGRFVVRTPLPLKVGDLIWALDGEEDGRLRIGPLRSGRFEARVDGDLSDWTHQANTVGDGKWWAATSAEGLTFAIEVQDTQPTNPASDHLMWQGDSIELFVAPFGPSGSTVIDKATEFQLGFAPTGPRGQPRAFWFHIDRTLDEASVATRTTDAGWTLEAFVPWEAILDGAVPEGPMGFDVKLNDLDADAEPARFEVWNGDGTNWIDPSRWGLVVPTGFPAPDVAVRGPASGAR